MANDSKCIVFVGANSRIVQTILSTQQIAKYRAVYLISHRPYHGIDRGCYNVIDGVAPLHIISVIEKIFNNESSGTKFDLLLGNTPPQNADYLNPTTMEWALVSIKIMNFLASSPKVNKTIFLGSCLALIPLFRSSTYKSIKYLEYATYRLLYRHNKNNIKFCLLPPLTPGVSGLGKYFAEPTSRWAYKLISHFESQPTLILPDGVVGGILRLLIALDLRLR